MHIILIQAEQQLFYKPLIMKLWKNPDKSSLEIKERNIETASSMSLGQNPSF